ncbi:hypothetical protein ACM66B_006246 [Microbotryomycetes sp. NB124-2]
MVNARSSQTVTVGVLALQGSFDEHIQIINKLDIQGVKAVQVRTAAQLEQCRGLILPGGESTTISLLASKGGLLEPLREFVQEARRGRKAVWGTCAGMILLANSVVGANAGFEGFDGIDCSVVRNQWGRQSESFSHQLEVKPFAEPFNAVFIRAPVVHTINEDDGCAKSVPPLQVLARVPKSILPQPSQAALASGGAQLGPDADVVMLRQGNVLASSFHPELTGDWRVHEWWLRTMVLASADE